MDLSFKDKLDKGRESKRLMIDEANTLDEPYLSLEMKRLIQYEDVLVKVFGDEQYEEDFNWLKEDKGLNNFEEDKGLKSFEETLKTFPCEVIQYNWKPVSGGNIELINALDFLRNYKY